MRKLIIPILAALIAVSCSKTGPETTTLTLDLKNVDFEKAEVTLLTDFIGFNVESILAEAGSDGKFTFELKLEQPQLVYISLGQLRSLVYLSRGGSLEVTGDLLNWDPTYAGTYANENNFLKLKSTEIDQYYTQSQVVNLIRNNTLEEFLTFNDQLTQAARNLLRNFQADNKLDEEFHQFVSTDIEYNRYTYLLYYPLYFSYFHNGEEPQLPDGYFDFMADALKATNEKFLVRSFCNFITENLQLNINKSRGKFDEGVTQLEKSITIANDIYSGQMRDYAVAHAIHSGLNWGDFGEASKAWYDFREKNTHPQLNKMLQTAYENAKRIAPGNVAPSFTLTDINGKQVSLSDFRGKVVYLDFWASWCGPCMREIPHAKELKKKFEEREDLVFLYISVDEDEAAWRRTVEAQDIKGVHLNVKGMGRETAQMYNVKGVPTFFIIDKDGVINNNNPGRPSSGAVIENQLKTALGLLPS